MYSKFGTLIAVILAIFPFATVLLKLMETETSTTVLVVAAMVGIFFTTVFIASRITLDPEPAAAAAPPAPAPPIAWSWDGVSDQPDGPAPRG